MTAGAVTALRHGAAAKMAKVSEMYDVTWEGNAAQPAVPARGRGRARPDRPPAAGRGRRSRSSGARQARAGAGRPYPGPGDSSEGRRFWRPPALRAVAAGPQRPRLRSAPRCPQVPGR